MEGVAIRVKWKGLASIASVVSGSGSRIGPVGVGKGVWGVGWPW